MYAFKCEDCGKGYSNENALRVHRYRCYSGEDERRSASHSPREQPPQDLESQITDGPSKIMEKFKESRAGRKARMTKMQENRPMIKKLRASAAKIEYERK